MNKNEVLSRENRIKELEKIKKESVPELNLKIKYKGEMRILPAYKIPLNCVLYNQYNGRIASRVKSFEKEYRPLNPEKTEDREVIERFLWESEEERNEITIKNLVKEGQRIAGVVTKDGKIADGNRRVSLLRKICDNSKKYSSTDISKCEYFIAVILDEDLSKREMLQLELDIQMVDREVDYNPIEKYLKCEQLRDEGDFSIEEIRDMMNYKSDKDVETSLGIKKLMDDYLDYIDCSGIYTCLDKKEDIFIGLYDSIKKYSEGKKAKKLDWAPDELDIQDLKIATFNYIRYGGTKEKDYRLVSGASTDAFFNSEVIWKKYKNTTESIIEKANDEEKSLDDLRSQYPESNLESLIKSRDEEWRNKINSSIQEAYSYCFNMVESKKDDPYKILKMVDDKLDMIDSSQEAFYTKDIEELLKKINLKICNFEEINKKGMKDD